MKVGDWMSRELHTCRSDETLNDVAHLFWSRDCGFVPVLDERGALVGVVTDRDACMGAHFRGRPLTEIAVSETMSRDPQVCRPSDELASAVTRMGELRVRRMPVVDERGTLAGVITVGDAARAAALEKDAGARERLAHALLQAQVAILGAVPKSSATPPAAGAPEPALPDAREELVPRARPSSKASTHGATSSSERGAERGGGGRANRKRK
jgi:CBS domain-containing protein